MRSMTGYGTNTLTGKDVTLEVSIRAVNGRFLETRFHSPREYISFEADLKKILNQFIQRGTVDVFIFRRVKSFGEKAAMNVNKPLAKKYLGAYRQLAKDLQLPFQMHIEFLGKLPDVIQVENSYQLFPNEEKNLKKVFEQACRNCEREREREGKALRKDLESHLSLLEKQIKVISSLREEVNRQLQDKFEQKIKSRLKGAEVDAGRLSQEIVIQLEKADINEELMRLSEHIQNYRQLVTKPQVEGKKLDFYTQELLREVNTIGSKSQVAKITQSVVEAKTIIERLREQVQNVQ